MIDRDYLAIVERHFDDEDALSQSVDDHVSSIKTKFSLNEDSTLVRIRAAVELDVENAKGTEHPLNINQFAVFGILGSGATSVVFDCIDNNTNVDVAVKMALPDASERVAGEVWREPLFLGKMNHPNIVKFIMNGFWNSRPYIVTKLVRGKSLIDAHAEFSQEDSLQVIERVLGAMSYAEENDVIHLDLKPANIIIGENKEPVIVDWGGSNFISDKAYVNFEHSTPRYSAPERGSMQSVQSDIYSIGVILIELLTKKGFGDGSLALLNELDVSPRIKSACRKAIETDPNRRFKSHKQFRSIVRAVTHRKEWYAKAARYSFLFASAVALALSFIVRIKSGYAVPTMGRGTVSYIYTEHVWVKPRVASVAEFRLIATDKSKVFEPQHGDFFLVRPGDYLLSIRWSGETFTTVHRHVPSNQETAGQFVRRKFKRSSGFVTLAIVHKPRRQIIAQPAYKDLEFSDVRRSGLNFDLAIQELENLGLRLPTLKEADQIRPLLNNNELDFWTSEVESYEVVEDEDSNQRLPMVKMLNRDPQQVSRNFCLTQDQSISFFGVRDTTPLGFDR